MNVTPHAVAHLYQAAEFDEAALRDRVEAGRAALPDGRADLAIVFISPQFLPNAAEILEVVQVHAHARLLVGCSGSGVIANDREVEDAPAVAWSLLHLPGAVITPVRFTAAEVEEMSDPDAWHERTGVGATASRGWLALADPFSFDVEGWLDQWNEAYPGVPAVGGLASSSADAGRTHLFLNQETFGDGGIALSIAGSHRLEPLVSQGCRPIGRPWTVTSAERNIIQKIGNLPALAVLQDTFEELPEADKARAGGNIFVGLAVNEYQEEHRRGDFLVRNLIAADPRSGVVAVGARVRVGQTLQFQFRDGDAATEDLSELLASLNKRLAGDRVTAIALFSCTGRGAGLFGHPHHDASQVQSALGSSIPLAGFFCNGEIGPIGGRNFLHGYTASAAFFVSDDPHS